MPPAHAANAAAGKGRGRLPFKPPRPTSSAWEKASAEGERSESTGFKSAAQAFKAATTVSRPQGAPQKSKAAPDSESDGMEDDDGSYREQHRPRKVTLGKGKAIEISSSDESEREDELMDLDKDMFEDTDSEANLPTSRQTKPHKSGQGGKSAVQTSTSRTSAAHKPLGEDGPPPIPQALLTRLLHEGLEDKDVKVGKEAMAVLGKYFETFVREAVARAVAEHKELEAGADGTRSGIGSGFIQVEDLERLAAQLVLDF